MKSPTATAPQQPAGSGTLDGVRPAAILSIIATCIAHEVEPRAYLHRVTAMLVNGWPQSRLCDLLVDRMLVAHPELFAGDRSPTAEAVDSS